MKSQQAHFTYGDDKDVWFTVLTNKNKVSSKGVLVKSEIIPFRNDL